LLETIIIQILKKTFGSDGMLNNRQIVNVLVPIVRNAPIQFVGGERSSGTVQIFVDCLWRCFHLNFRHNTPLPPVSSIQVRNISDTRDGKPSDTKVDEHG